MSCVSFLPLLLNEDCSLRFTPLVEPVLRTLLPAFNTAATIRLVACLAGRLLTNLRNTDGTFSLSVVWCVVENHLYPAVA